MSNLSLHCQRQLNLFRRKYLQLQSNIGYPDAQCLRQDVFQQSLEMQLFSGDFVDYQPPKRYQILVLKELVKRIEASITDWEEEGISDGLMSRLSDLLASPLPSEAVLAQQKSYVTYTLSSLSKSDSPPILTILEARNLLAATGTTGFRTWEACLHLGNYLCSPSCPITIADKNVLELGAGTGYLSILCAKHLHAAHVTATDGSAAIVADLPTNFFLNGLQDSTKIEARELKWGQALLGGEQAEWNRGISPDVILGADVTYDVDTIPALISTLVNLTGMFPTAKVVIAATVRNEETFKRFVNTCNMNGFVLEEIAFPVLLPETQEGPFYSNGVPIRLCNLEKR